MDAAIHVEGLTKRFGTLQVGKGDLGHGTDMVDVRFAGRCRDICLEIDFLFAPQIPGRCASARIANKGHCVVEYRPFWHYKRFFIHIYP